MVELKPERNMAQQEENWTKNKSNDDETRLSPDHAPAHL